MNKIWNVLNQAGLALFLIVVLTGLILWIAGSLQLGQPSQTPGGRSDTVCTRCNPALVPVFKARGDWCAEHNLPESQCVLCNPGLTLAAAPWQQGQRAAVGNPAPDPQHMATCTRCNPALIPGFKAKGDWCDLHNFPKSQCVACNPALGPAYKAKGDWCDLHNLPKSQCTVCTPSLKQLPTPKVEAPKTEPMCVIHNIPLSQCTICRPAPAPKGPPKAAPKEQEAQPAPEKGAAPPDAAPEPQ